MRRVTVLPHEWLPLTLQRTKFLQIRGSAKNFPSIAKAADMAIRKATKQIAKTPGGVVLQRTGSINTDELIRIVDDRAVRSVVSTGSGFDVIALEENGSLLFARRYKK